VDGEGLQVREEGRELQLANDRCVQAGRLQRRIHHLFAQLGARAKVQGSNNLSPQKATMKEE
jgi:hypothetical protein